MAKEYKKIGTYPSPYLPKDEKLKDGYGLQYAKSLFYEFSGPDNIKRQKYRARIVSNRMFREGSQPSSAYMDRAGFKGDTMYANINFEPLPIIAKFVDIVVSRMMDSDYYVSVDGIDELSVGEKGRFKKELELRLTMELEAEEMGKAIGATLKPPQAPFKTQEEIEVFMDTSYKLYSEIAAEKGIMFTMDNSHFEETRRRVIEDIVVAGMGVTKTWVDENYVIKTRYVDIENFVYSYSSDPSFRKLQHGGEVRVITASELRRLAAGKITEKELEAIANTKAGRNNNPDAHAKRGLHSGYTSEFNYYYDSFQLTIMEFDFLTDCNLVYEKKPSKYGGADGFYKRKEGYETENELVKTQYQTVLGGIWVIGTDHIFNYGEVDHIPRKKDKLYEAELPWTVHAPSWYRQDNKSLLERMIPPSEDMQVIQLKMQQLIAKARPPGLAIDVNGLKDIMLDGINEANPIALQEVFDQTGNQYYNGLDDDGDTRKSPPMMPLENGIAGNSLQSLIVAYNHNMQMLRDATGLNEYTDGTGINEKSLVGTSEIALQASNHAIGYISDGWINITKRTADKILTALLYVVRKNKKMYGGIIGDLGVEVLSSMEDFTMRKYAIAIDIGPTENEKRQLEGSIQQAIQKGMLAPGDDYFIRNIRNFKEAQKLLTIKSKMYVAQERAQKQEDMQLQGQINQQSAMTASEAKMKEIQALGNNDMMLAQFNHAAKMKELYATGQTAMQGKNIEAQGKVAAASASHDRVDKRDYGKEVFKDERNRETKSMESKIAKQKETSAPPLDFTTN